MFKRREPLSPVGRLRRLLWPSMGLRRSGRYFAYKVGRIQGTAHAIALGLACGVFLSMTPLLGLHIPLAFALAWSLRASMMAAVLGTVLANPWTFAPIWYASYRLGCLLLGVAPGHSSRTHLTLTFLLDHPWQVFLPMLTGGSVMGLVLGTVSYLVAKPVIRFYQQRRIDRRRAKMAAVATRMKDRNDV